MPRKNLMLAKIEAKYAVDRRILQIVGAKNFSPWDERYAVGGEERSCGDG